MKTDNKFPVEDYSDLELYQILRNPNHKEYNIAFEKLIKAIQIAAYSNLMKEDNNAKNKKQYKDSNIIDRVIDKLFVKLNKEKGTPMLLSDYHPDKGSIVYYLGQIKFLFGRYQNEINSIIVEDKKEKAYNSATKRLQDLLKEINNRKIIVVVSENELGKPYNINKQQIATYANYKPELIPHPHNSLINSKGYSLYSNEWDKLQSLHNERILELKSELEELVKTSLLGQARTFESKNKQILKLMDDYKIIKLKTKDFCKLMNVTPIQAHKFRSNLRLNKYLIKIIS